MRLAGSTGTLFYCERVKDDSTNAASLPVNWEELNQEPYVISDEGEGVDPPSPSLMRKGTFGGWAPA